jgi:hypothetical protein
MKPSKIVKRAYKAWSKKSTMTNVPLKAWVKDLAISDGADGPVKDAALEWVVNKGLA